MQNSVKILYCRKNFKPPLPAILKEKYLIKEVKMAQEEGDYISPLLGEFNTVLRDVEERQRLLKDRVLLVSKNLVESREETEEDLAQIKADLEILKAENSRMKDTMERILEEISELARKEEVMILYRQFKMFEPLKFARIEDVKDMIEKSKG